MNESKMQAVLMGWVMDVKNHELAVPNTTSIYRWEADLISVTKAGLAHEFEVKCTRSDFRADRNKRYKHGLLADAYDKKAYLYSRCPSYFWYVINSFSVGEDELPPYAGLIEVAPSANKADEYYGAPGHAVNVRRPAPRIHTEKIPKKKKEAIGRLLSYKLKKAFVRKHLQTAV